jgi:hypothetical protein
MPERCLARSTAGSCVSRGAGAAAGASPPHAPLRSPSPRSVGSTPAEEAMPQRRGVSWRMTQMFQTGRFYTARQSEARLGLGVRRWLVGPPRVLDSWQLQFDR